MNISSWLWQFLFPTCCLACGREQEWYWCASCQQKTSPPEPLAIPAPTPLSQAWAARYYHDPPIARLIHAAKYRGVPEALRQLVAVVCRVPPPITGAPPVLVPIPLHRRRFRQRGFNQADLIAQTLGHYWNWSVDSTLLERVLATTHQVGKNRAERQHNVSQAFRVRPLIQLPSSIMLIDDVLTTGATMAAAATAIQTIKPISVSAYTIAYEPYSHSLS